MDNCIYIVESASCSAPWEMYLCCMISEEPLPSHKLFIIMYLRWD